MKKIIFILILLVADLANAQIAVGKSSITLLPSPNPTGAVNPFISLEFGDSPALQGKGIVLPWVTNTSAVTGSVTGTIFLDVSDKIIKYQNGAGSYFNLSKNEITQVGTNNSFNTAGIVNTTLQDGLSDLSDAKVSIGPIATPAIPGVLVLETTNQAMILPKVASPHLNIVSPEPGTMVYDTVSRQLAVFNGTVWSFWKP